MRIAAKTWRSLDVLAALQEANNYKYPVAILKPEEGTATVLGPFSYPPSRIIYYKL
jgi:hypothetical protein